MKQTFVILFTLISLVTTAQNNVRFETKINARQVLLGKYFQVTFTLHNAEGADFKSPRLNDFKIVTGPNPSSNMMVINGAVTRSMGYSYYLEPRRVGKFTIGAATIKANGKTYKTKPVSIEVIQPKGSSAQTQEDLQRQIEKQVFIRAEVNKETAYVGEQVTLDFKIYTRMEVSGYNMVEEPDFQGFFAREVTDFDGGVIQEVLNGEQYSTKIIRRVALFPQQTGTLEIGSLIMNLGLGKRNDIFGSFFSQASNYRQFETKPISINVRSLPNNAPESFSGAVGDYTMTAVVNRKSASTDESFTLQMQVTGDGDIKRVQAPRLSLNSEVFEIYDPQMNETSFEEDGQIYSTKIIEYLILPKREGQYDFTPEFTFFDTDSVGFKTLKASKLNLQVTKGTNKPNQSNTRPNSAGNDIRFIETKARLSNRKGYFMGSILFWILFLLPFIAFAGVGYRKYQLNNTEAIDPLLLKQQKANQVALKRLETAKLHLDANAPKPFFESVSQALWGYVSDKLNIPASEISKLNVRIKLLDRNVNGADIDKFLNCIQNCEMALFASMDNAEAMNKTYQDAIDVIASMALED